MKLRVNRSLIVGILAVIFAVGFAGSLFALIYTWETQRSVGYLPEVNRNTITYQGVTYRQRKDLDTVLIMGLDKYDADQESGKYLNRQQSDFIMLMVVNRDEKSYSILHLNRDTMTDMSVLGDRGERVDRVNGQLALAHTYGSGGAYSCRNAVEAVSNLLHGVKVDHYLALTMDAVAMLNDLAGGVTVEVLDDFSDIAPELVKGKTVTLMGKQALTYVRTRWGMEDSSNLRRMERQRQYLQALQEQINRKYQEDPDFFARALKETANYLQSDLTGNQMSLISERVNGYTFTGFETIPGEAKLGETYMEYYVDEDALMDTVLRLFYKPV